MNENDLLLTLYKLLTPYKSMSSIHRLKNFLLKSFFTYGTQFGWQNCFVTSKALELIMFCRVRIA